MDNTRELLTNKLFEKPLKNYLSDDSIKIIKCESNAAVAVGENYTSQIFRTVITYIRENSARQEKISTIVKCFPDNEMILGLVKEFKLFETEAEIYTNILPLINNVLEKSERILPNCIHYEKSDTQIIVFEDLSVMNFKMYPRRKGLDLEHCLLVVERLACLHASSLVHFEKDLSWITKYTEGIYGDNYFTKQWSTTGIDALIEACLKWPGYEKYAKKLKAVKEQLHEKLQDSKYKNGFNVLNHGDMWINNFMFLYDSQGNVKDLRLVDLQLIIYGSPCIDLMYFWVANPNIEVRLNNFDQIFDHYHSKLTALLERMNYSDNVPSKEELLQDFYSRAFYGLIVSITVLPIVTAPKRDDASLEEMVKDNEDGFRHESFNNEIYRKYMEYLLPYFEKQKILD